MRSDHGLEVSLVVAPSAAAVPGSVPGPAAGPGTTTGTTTAPAGGFLVGRLPFTGWDLTAAVLVAVLLLMTGLALLRSTTPRRTA